MANENDIPTEADQLRTAVQEVIKEIATLKGKVADRDDSEKNKLQTELATLQGEVAEVRAGKKELLEKLLAEVRAAHFEERTS